MSVLNIIKYLVTSLWSVSDLLVLVEDLSMLVADDLLVVVVVVDDEYSFLF